MTIKSILLLLFLFPSFSGGGNAGGDSNPERDDTIIWDPVTNEILWLPSAALTLGDDYRFSFKNGVFKNDKGISKRHLDTFEVYLDEVGKAKELSTLSKSNNECYHDVRMFLNFPQTAPRSTLREVAQNSKVAILGKIVHISQGFKDTTPYSLLTIDILQDFKRSGTKKDVSSLKILYPHAFFEIGDLRFCQNTADITPKIGQNIQWFTFKPIDYDVKIHYIDPTLIFLEGKDGQVVSPMKVMKNFTYLDFYEFKNQTEYYISNL